MTSSTVPFTRPCLQTGIMSMAIYVGAILLSFFPLNVAALEGRGSAEVWHPELEALVETSRTTWETSEPGLPKGLSFPLPTTLKKIRGENHLIRITGKKHVELKDLDYAVSWQGPKQPRSTSLIVISNCERGNH